MDNVEGILERKGEGCADENLVADPFRRRGPNVKRVEQTRPNRTKRRANRHRRCGVARLRHNNAAEEDEDAGGDDHGQVMDARLDSVHPLDALEVNREVVEEEEIAAGEEELEDPTRPDRAAFEQPRHQHAVLALERLPDPHGDRQEDGSDQQPDNCAAVPGVGLSAVLEGENKADDGAHGQHDAHGIHLQELLLPAGLDDDGGRRGREVEEEEDEDGGNAADGQVDVEAPAPADALGEGAAEQRPDDGRDVVGDAEEAHQRGPLLGRDAEREDGGAARRDAGAAQAGDGAADDQGRGVGRHPAEQAADLEDGHRRDEGRLQGEILVRLAPGRLEPAQAHEVRRAVPGDLVDAVELVRDLGDGGADDGLPPRVTLGGQEDGNKA